MLRRRGGFENASTQTVQIRNLSAGPLENTQTWVVKATSGNTALIPNPAIAPSSGTGTLSTANLTFKPNASATGFAIITVEITDAGLSTFSRDFRIDVSAINDAPTLDAISNVTVQEDAPQQDITLTGITAGPQETQVLAVTATTNKPELFEMFNVIYTSPQNTATLRLKPKANTFGVATITATVTDDGSNVAPSINFRTRQFTFTIQSVNDAPVFTSTPVEEATVGELYEYVLTVTDIDADAITITAPVKPAWLTLTSQGNGTSKLSGTPPVNAAGPATVRIQARDAPGATVLQDFTIDVNARPIVSDLAIAASEDVSYAFTLQDFAGAFTDADGSPLAAIKFTSLPDHGTIRLNQQAVAAGAEVAATSIANLTYLSDENYFGKDTLSWVGSDGSDYSSLPARVFITIAPVNDAPVVSALETEDVTYLVGDGPATISALFEASDVDNDSLVGAQVEIRQETFVPGEDVLLFTGTQNIQGTFDGQTGILVLNGKAPIAAYSEAIRTVQYNNISLLFIENGAKV
ncbi:MAG: hypothetical protein HC859_16185, partial [Bacteroidia bacterium]|nr:hypothetical protein [Bacteroidia bacterium]